MSGPAKDARAVLSIVIPVYFNERNLPVTFDVIEAALRAADPPLAWEFVFVDDGSKDCSYVQMEALHARAPDRVRLVRLTRNFGQVPALLAGLRHARGAAAVVMSADLQDPPELIVEMFRRWSGGERKIVLASRTGREDGFFARMTSGVFYRLMRRYAVPNMPPGGFDFFLIDRAVIDLVDRIDEKNTFLQGHILWTGYEPVVLPYTRRKREIGKSKWTLRKKLKYFVDGFVTYSLAPLRLMTMLGLLVSLAAFAWSAVILVRYLSYGHMVEGWAPLMLGVLFLGGVQLVMLGVMGEYVWRSYYESRKLPNYVVQSVVETTGRR